MRNMGRHPYTVKNEAPPSGDDCITRIRWAAYLYIMEIYMYIVVLNQTYLFIALIYKCLLNYISLAGQYVSIVFITNIFMIFIMFNDESLVCKISCLTGEGLQFCSLFLFVFPQWN